MSIFSKRKLYLLNRTLQLIRTNPKILFTKIKQKIKLNKSKHNQLDHQKIKLLNKLNLDHHEHIFEIVVPIYNGYNYVEKLIKMLISHLHVKYRLILINDASTDPLIKELLSKLQLSNTHHEIIIKHNKDNLGFVKTANLGMSLTCGHFILLNSDTEVPLHFAIKLITPIIDNSRIASVTPFSNSGAICSFPNFNEDNQMFMNLNVQQLDNSFANLDPVQNQQIPTGVGFCMAINHNIYREIGGFDEEVFSLGYGEENDWCMRALNKGYIHIQAINCFIYHKHGGSFSKTQKQDLLSRNIKLLTKKHPSYMPLIYKYCAQDPLQNLRFFQIINIICDNFSCDCIINTIYKGGAQTYINNTIKNGLINGKAFIIIESHNLDKQATIKVYCNTFHFEFKLKDIFNLLQKLKLNNLIINHLLFESNIGHVISQIKHIQPKLTGKLITILHDYFYVCPTVNLLDYQDKYCGVPSDLKQCDTCLASFSQKNINFSYVSLYRSETSNIIGNWRNLIGGFLDFVDQIIVPSTYSMEIFLKAYPNYVNKIQVLAHNLDYMNLANFNLTYKPFISQQIKIAAIGDITIHKGSKIIAQMIKLSQNEGLNIQWYVFGELSGASINNLHIIKYNGINELNELVNQHQIDIFIIPSIWPETFCFSASEAMYFNLPVITFNLGAHAARVASYNNGKLVNLISAKDMLDMIKATIKQNINIY